MSIKLFSISSSSKLTYLVATPWSTHSFLSWRPMSLPSTRSLATTVLESYCLVSTGCVRCAARRRWSSSPCACWRWSPSVGSSHIRCWLDSEWTHTRSFTLRSVPRSILKYFTRTRALIVLLELTARHPASNPRSVNCLYSILSVLAGSQGFCCSASWPSKRYQFSW